MSEGETKPALGLSLNISDDSYPSDTADTGTLLLSPLSKYNINSISSSPVLYKPLSPLSPIIGPSPSTMGVPVITPGLHTQVSNGKITPISVILTCIKNLDKNKHNLSGWVFKKTGKNNKVYSKKYLFIKSHHLIWDNKKMNKNEAINVDVNNLKNYDGFIHFFRIKSVQACISPKSNNNSYKFIINTHVNKDNKKFGIKHYVFKCETKYKRDKWVKGLNKYCQYSSKIVNALQDSDL